jgi:hypothetical protein
MSLDNWRGTMSIKPPAAAITSNLSGFVSGSRRQGAHRGAEQNVEQLHRLHDANGGSGLSMLAKDVDCVARKLLPAKR